ncbi:hypothetical protein RUM44_009619 [Polyplax serrata]|uniref:Uncharacterized protein n=1 Tax=Polyplax serrata TaxID=468196 RepID=A0ABR1AT75_POLSC
MPSLERATMTTGKEHRELGSRQYHTGANSEQSGTNSKGDEPERDARKFQQLFFLCVSQTIRDQEKFSSIFFIALDKNSNSVTVPEVPFEELDDMTWYILLTSLLPVS